MSHISPAAKGRLLREMSLVTKDPPPGVAAYTPHPSDMTHIRAQLTGPEGSPFEGGVFLLTVHITGRYPFEPPRCRFLTPLYHPNIDAGGRICLDTLKSPPAGSWSPAVSLPSLLLSIRSLMAEPNPDDGLVPEISDLYKRNPSGWEKEARRRTKVDATVEKLEEVESALDGTNTTKDNKNSEAGDAKENSIVSESSKTESKQNVSTESNNDADTLDENRASKRRKS